MPDAGDDRVSKPSRIRTVVFASLAIVVLVVVGGWLRWAMNPQVGDSSVHFPHTCWEGAVLMAGAGTFLLLILATIAVGACIGELSHRHVLVGILSGVVGLVLALDVFVAVQYAVQLANETSCE